MNKVSLSGYLFIQSGILNKLQVETSILNSIDYLQETYPEINFSKDILVNVVTNKEGKKFGHTYVWVSDNSVYNALLGKNFDGTTRFEYKEDENWKPPEKSYDEAMAETDDWAAWDDIERSYKRPKIKIPLEPLVTLPAIKYTEEQLKEIENKSLFGFLELNPIKITPKPDRINTLFSNDIPSWVNEDILFNFFRRFETDELVHIDKKKKKKFQYPLIKIKQRKAAFDERRFCTVEFSVHQRQTVLFLINVVKRIEITDGKKKALMFFSQSKSQGY